MQRIYILLLFVLINFGALALGGFLMDNGPMTNWYLDLNKAPWTPPGWIFGVAWTTIMIGFSFYMMYLYTLLGSKKIRSLFIVQFILNVSWNYVFFNQQLFGLGLAVIIGLTLVTFYFLFFYRRHLKLKSILIVPYSIWLCIATSLNAYIVIFN